MQPGTRYTLITTATVRRQLTERLPETVAAAAYEFITGPLLDNPHRIGKPLSAPFHDRYSSRRGTYRIIYRIDDATRIVTVVLIEHRRRDVLEQLQTSVQGAGGDQPEGDVGHADVDRVPPRLGPRGR